MYNFAMGQWYQRGGEIVYVYDIDNLEEYVWLMPAIYPQPYDIGKSQPNISQYEYFKDMHEYEHIIPPCFEIDDVVVYIGPDVTFEGIMVLKNNSLVQIVNKHDESYGDHYGVIMPEIALSVRVTPYEIKKSTISQFFLFLRVFERRRTMEIEAQMWVLYQDEPYFLQEMIREYYILYNIHNEPTKIHKNDAHFKTVEIPVFQVGDLVVSKTNYYPDLTGTVVKITQVLDDVYIPYEINGEYWFTPFDMVPINY